MAAMLHAALDGVPASTESLKQRFEGKVADKEKLAAVVAEMERLKGRAELLQCRKSFGVRPCFGHSAQGLLFVLALFSRVTAYRWHVQLKLSRRGVFSSLCVSCHLLISILRFDSWSIPPVLLHSPFCNFVWLARVGLKIWTDASCVCCVCGLPTLALRPPSNCQATEERQRSLQCCHRHHFTRKPDVLD